MSARFRAIVWHEEAFEDAFVPEKIHVVRSQETLMVADASLGGLFSVIRENQHLLIPDQINETQG